MSKMTQMILLLFVPPLILAGTGCTPQMQRGRAAAQDTRDSNTSMSTAKRFQDTAEGSRTVVESAIELSDKYARLSDETVTLRERNQQLEADNLHLLQQIETLETKLAQTQKELGEANDLLIEMLTELNNWKSSILGFRGEMREAAKAQLEALLKVLEILGGEAEAGTLERRHLSTLRSGLDLSAQSGTPTMSPVGEANEP